jgi:anthranilate phosphoribosyltransferase
VVLHGGGPMPVKYGLTAGEALAALDLDLRDLPWNAVERLFAGEGLALLHQPRHFPAAERLVPIREQIGKRPPIATLELLWSCYEGPCLQVSGFVHAPTEGLAWEALAAAGQDELLMVKGVEGGAELPTNRVAIASHRQGGLPERLILRARDHGLWAPETALESLGQWRGQALQALQATGPLRNGLLWNGGFLLWRAGIAESLEEGLALAERLLRDGAVERLRRHLSGRLAEAEQVRTPSGPTADPAGC